MEDQSVFSGFWDVFENVTKRGAIGPSGLRRSELLE